MDLLTSANLEALLRLLLAAICGMVVGINRDLRGKPTGMRTLGLVAMGAALVALTGMGVAGVAGHPDATSRVVQGIIQGVMTGIGFLGAGVVLHKRRPMRIHGLTTAATVWVTAALGIACALAPWHLIIMGIAVTLILLIVALPVERFIEGRAGVPVRHHGQARPPAPASPDALPLSPASRSPASSETAAPPPPVPPPSAL